MGDKETQRGLSSGVHSDKAERGTRMVDRAASETRDPCTIAEEERDNRSQIEDMEHEEAGILESERRLRNRNAYRTSIWDQIIEKQEKEEARERAERLQARACAMTKSSWAKKDLKQCGNEYRMF
ncbi:MAG: hypothetical protein Q9175_002533 [Cornicularia normoerica]